MTTTTATTEKIINVKDYEMTTGDGIGVYCGTYRKYNEGSIYGAWLDLSKFKDSEEFFAVCRELHADEYDPEFMFQDFQGFPRNLYCESMGAETIDKIIEYAALSEDEREMLDDYAEIFGEMDIEQARDRCMGCYESKEEYAEQYADECLNIPENIKYYFDYAAFARDLFMDLYMGDNGYVFTAA